MIRKPPTNLVTGLLTFLISRHSYEALRTRFEINTVIRYEHKQLHIFKFCSTKKKYNENTNTKLIRDQYHDHRYLRCHHQNSWGYIHHVRIFGWAYFRTITIYYIYIFTVKNLNLKM